MTEKRFECDKGSRIIIDNETKLHYIMTLDWECRLITKLLNHFSEENEQLKFELQSTSDQRDEFHRGARENANRVGKLEKENEQLKKVLGSILIEVRRDISNTNYIGEIKVFINSNSFELISEVLRKYGALKDWYE